jgi:hypothetical protein
VCWLASADHRDQEGVVRRGEQRGECDRDRREPGYGNPSGMTPPIEYRTPLNGARRVQVPTDASSAASPPQQTPSMQVRPFTHSELEPQSRPYG